MTNYKVITRHSDGMNCTMEQTLLKAVGIRAVADHGILQKMLDNTPHSQVKRRRNLARQLAECDEFIDSAEFSLCVGSSAAETIRKNLDEIDTERVLWVLENIANI